MRLCSLLLVAALGACSSGFVSRDTQPTVYVLRVAGTAGPATSEGPTIAVARPSVAPGLASERIVLLGPDHRLDVFAASEWAAETPDMIGALVRQQLLDSGGFRAVVEEQDPFAAELLLSLRVTEFWADYSQATPPVVRVRFDCLLGSERQRQLLGTFTVTAEVQAAANRMAAVVTAFEQATQQALREVNREVIARGEAASAQNEDSPVASITR
ncbi:MAG: ABC-type transport auxiliary lipoprotein family protein [Steroidobacteraceae bacterium]